MPCWLSHFYTTDLNLLALGGAAVVLGALYAMNRAKVLAIWPYLLLGAVLWVVVFASGIHATFAGVLLAFTIPLKATRGTPEAERGVSPLHDLEHRLHKPVAFIVVPIFGFANAGVSFASASLSLFTEPLTLGVAAGLTFGKMIGVLGTVTLLVKLKLAGLPAKATWGQMVGVTALCGIGFTMSLFIGLLAFNDPSVQDHIKMGILLGSILSDVVGAVILCVANRKT